VLTSILASTTTLSSRNSITKFPISIPVAPWRSGGFGFMVLSLAAAYSSTTFQSFRVWTSSPPCSTIMVSVAKDLATLSELERKTAFE